MISSLDTNQWTAELLFDRPSILWSSTNPANERDTQSSRVNACTVHEVLILNARCLVAHTFAFDFPFFHEPIKC